MIACRGTDDDDATLSASSREGRPQPPDEPGSHSRGPVLVSDVQVSAPPLVPYLCQHGCQQLEQDVTRFAPGSECLLDDGPSTRLVAAQKSIT